jgi:hypothetical protein
MRNAIWSLLSLCLLGTALGRAEEKAQRPPVAAKKDSPVNGTTATVFRLMSDC